MLAVRLPLILLTFLTSLLAASPNPALGAHPFHICVGEMQWNSESKKWEVGLRLHGADLQKSYEKQTQKPWQQPSKDSSDSNKKSSDPILEDLGKFLQTQFYLERRSSKEQGDAVKEASTVNLDGKNATQSRLTMLGTEEERGWLWLYFEIEEPAPLATNPDVATELWLHHQILLDEVEGQQNTLLVRNGDKRQSLRFQADMKHQIFQP